jgi:hypothetical protein
MPLDRRACNRRAGGDLDGNDRRVRAHHVKHVRFARNARLAIRRRGRHEPGHGDPAIVENAARHRMRVASCKRHRMT